MSPTRWTYQLFVLRVTRLTAGESRIRGSPIFQLYCSIRFIHSAWFCSQKSYCLHSVRNGSKELPARLAVPRMFGIAFIDLRRWTTTSLIKLERERVSQSFERSSLLVVFSDVWAQHDAAFLIMDINKMGQTTWPLRYGALQIDRLTSFVQIPLLKQFEDIFINWDHKSYIVCAVWQLPQQPNISKQLNKDM